MYEGNIEEIEKKMLEEWRGEATLAFAELIAAKSPSKDEKWPTEIFFNRINKYFLRTIDNLLRDHNWPTNGSN